MDDTARDTGAPCGDALDIPGWARDQIAGGQDPQAVLARWEADLAGLLNRRRADIAAHEALLGQLDGDPAALAERRRFRLGCLESARARYDAACAETAGSYGRLELAGRRGAPAGGAAAMLDSREQPACGPREPGFLT